MLSNMTYEGNPMSDWRGLYCVHSQIGEYPNPLMAQKVIFLNNQIIFSKPIPIVTKKKLTSLKIYKS